ncbi:MAG TPA: signal peptidase I [Thermoanaerobaculia bacterium]|nr:signal peptidase I [Thermoanaerobaculia bacterium]
MAAAAESQTKSTAREYYEALLIAIIFVNFARIFVFQAFKIPSGSMEDNLKIGDHIIVNKFIYGPAGTLQGLVPLREVRRGDIVVFRYPRQPEVDFVKRVVALPGETISIDDKKVSIDGRVLDEPYTLHEDEQVYPAGEFLPEPQRSRDQMKPFRVPAGQYFVMGDNRDHSSDSRYWGTVPRTMIKGRAFMVYWSFDWEPLPGGSSIRDRVRELGNVALHFFTKTRWKRTFFIVDSKYHYTPGVSSYGNE